MNLVDSSATSGSGMSRSMSVRSILVIGLLGIALGVAIALSPYVGLVPAASIVVSVVATAVVARLGLSLSGLGIAAAGWLLYGILAGADFVASAVEVDTGAVSVVGPKLIPLILLGVGLSLMIAAGDAIQPLTTLKGPERLLLGFMLVQFLSSLVGPDPVYTTFRWVQLTLPVAVAFLSPRAARLVWFRVSLLAMGVHLVLAWTFSWSIAGGDRLAGALHPAQLAFFASCVLVWSLWTILLNPSGVAWLAGLMAPLSIATIVVSRGRAGILAGLAALCVLLAIGLRERRQSWRLRFGLTGVVVTSVLLLMVSFSTQGFDWFARGRGQEVATLTGRTTSIWPQVFDVALERPFLGWGSGSLLVGSAAEAAGQRGQAHNAFLEAFLAAGVLGLVTWSAAVLLAAWHAGRLASQAPRQGLRFALVVGCLVFAISQSDPAGIGQVWLLVVALVGLEVGTNATVQEEEKTSVGYHHLRSRSQRGSLD
jgi:O-antigen ligase